LRRFEAGVPYDAARAQAAAELLAARPRRASRLTPARESEIRLALGMGWSPQQIAGRWKQQQRTAAERLSHESIYALIGADRKARGTLWQMLPRGGRRRRRAPSHKFASKRIKRRPFTANHLPHVGASGAST
jgi:IS30 family transposase